MDLQCLRVLEFDAVRLQLASYTACSIGRRHAEAATPSADLNEIQQLLNETTECRDLLSMKGNLPLGGITDISPLLILAEKGSVLNPHELLDILGAAQSIRSLKIFLRKIADDYPLLGKKASELSQFPTLEAEISACIGSSGHVLDSASPELSRIRSRRKTASQRIVDKLNDIITGSAKTFLQDAVIVQRGDRYCVPVKAEHRGALGGIVHDTSASGATLFIEPQAVVEIGNQIRELAIKETHEVARILTRLTDQVNKVSVPLKISVEVFGEIDYISARSRLAEHQNATVPALNRNGETRLLSARHPLLDKDRVVPIDIELGGSRNSILLLTGPNTGGKTVSLKTTGLLTIMAQCGLHVPAHQATINVFDEIFADIGDEQSLEQSLSTFSGHITNIVRILKNLRPNSLVLLDEIGAGTDPREGAALARSIMESFLKVKQVRVIATTHYGELKTYAFSTPGVENASVEFDNVTLAPTYRLLQGVPGASNAFAIAQRIGMPPEILADARVALTGSSETQEIMQGLEENHRHALEDARKAERARIEAQMLKRKYEEQLLALDRLRQEARQKAELEGRAIIKRAEDKIEKALNELRRANSEGKRTERARQAISDIGQELQEAVHDTFSETKSTASDNTVPGRPFRQGDRVHISSLNAAGDVLDPEVNNNAAFVLVQVGAMRITVPAEQLRLLDQSPVNQRRPSPARDGGANRPDRPAIVAQDAMALTNISAISMEKTLNISSQISLLGKRADEAVRNVEKYLDDAYAAGLNETRIVHGKGTGALRKAVQECLDSHPLVKSYATADADAGGAGATIVKLRES